MNTFKDLASLSNKYGYDFNHNLRYLALAELIQRYSIKEVLILGCGKGILEYVLPEEVSCTSIDINPEEIKIAKEINLGKKNRNFVVSDIFKFIKNPEKNFEAVLISEVLEEIEHDKEIIELVHNLIRPQRGLFLLTVPNAARLINKIHLLMGREQGFMGATHLREYTQDEIYRLLFSKGFKIIHTKYVYLYLPKEDFVRKIISVSSRLRKFILKIKPKWANYIITVSSPS